MLYLFLILLLTGISLTVVLWAGTYFFQGYIYTEPSAGIFWQAPAAALLLTIGYAIWMLSIAYSSQATSQNLPYDVLHRFSPKENMAEMNGRPAKKMRAIKADRKKTGADRDGDVVVYDLHRRDRGEFFYKAHDKGHPWQPDGVIAIEMEKHDGEMIRFNLVPPPAEGSSNREFASRDGWVLIELPGVGGGPTVVPYKFRWGRWFVNLFFNFGHLVVWFLGLWVVLRFQWSHALGFAVVMWGAFTLILMPMLLSYAGQVSAQRREPTAQIQLDPHNRTSVLA